MTMREGRHVRLFVQGPLVDDGNLELPEWVNVIRAA